MSLLDSLDHAARASAAPSALPVKEVADARPCLACSRPTWSRHQLCVACRRSGRVPPQRTVSLHDAAASLLRILSPQAASRLVSREMQRRHLLPTPLVGLVIYAGWLALFGLAGFVLLALGFFVLTGIDSEFALMLGGPLIVLVVLLVIIGPILTTGGAMTRVRHRVVRKAISISDDEVRLRFCAMCGYDLSGSAGARCPECGEPITYPLFVRDAAPPTAPGTLGLADGPDSAGT